MLRDINYMKQNSDEKGKSKKGEWFKTQRYFLMTAEKQKTVSITYIFPQ